MSICINRFAGVRRSEKGTSLTFKVSLTTRLVSESSIKLSVIHFILYVRVPVCLLNLGAGDMVSEIPTRSFAMDILRSQSH